VIALDERTLRVASIPTAMRRNPGEDHQPHDTAQPFVAHVAMARCFWTFESPRQRTRPKDIRD